ncbi:MAG TPA: thioesterase family protein [Verrucomicrobiae bacterium]|nr:thioesterase family protein [Verrucomicrobiae bacterium]
MANIPIGAKREQTLLVTSEEAIQFMGLENARVLSTPQMIGNMERTCRNLVLDFLEPGQDTVGTHVDVYHLAAAPMGTTVTFRAEILEVEKRRVKFKVECVDEKEKLGEGTHERAIINVASFAAKMAAKLAK